MRKAQGDIKRTIPNVNLHWISYEKIEGDIYILKSQSSI